MDRTTITLDVETRTRLRRIAAERGMSMAALIREAIDTTIEDHAPRPASPSSRRWTAGTSRSSARATGTPSTSCRPDRASAAPAPVTIGQPPPPLRDP